jgi:uncharacterized protein YjbJ (UPF0337 family)
MNSDQLEGNWKQLKGSIQKQWGKLTDDDFDVIAGNKEKLAGKLQERYGYSKEQAEEEIKNYSSSADRSSKDIRH